MKKFITEEQKEKLIKDIKSGKFTSNELMDKYKYPNLSSLHGSIFWWKKQGVLSDSDALKPKDTKVKTRRSHNIRLSRHQKIELHKDYECNLYSGEELAKMYGLPTKGAVSSILSRFRKSKYFATMPSLVEIAPKVENTSTVSTPVKTATTTPLAVTNTVRTINFPDGFKIQIEKSFVSGVLIHENGNITIVK